MIKKENPGWTVEGSALPPAKKTAGQIEKETMNNRISNDERRVTSDELRNSSHFIFQRAERAYSAEMATKAGSDIHNSSIVIRYAEFRCSA